MTKGERQDRYFDVLAGPGGFICCGLWNIQKDGDKCESDQHLRAFIETNFPEVVLFLDQDYRWNVFADEEAREIGAWNVRQTILAFCIAMCE